MRKLAACALATVSIALMEFTAQADPVTQEVRRTFDRYLKAFQSKSVDATLEYYSFPLQLVTDKGTVLIATEADGRAFLSNAFGALALKGYTSSEWTRLDIHALSNHQALARAKITRFKAKTPIEVTGATYILVKSTDSKWRIAVGSSHPAR